MTNTALSCYPRWWGRGDSNPHALRHMILSHVASASAPNAPLNYSLYKLQQYVDTVVTFFFLFLVSLRLHATVVSFIYEIERQEVAFCRP